MKNDYLVIALAILYTLNFVLLMVLVYHDLLWFGVLSLFVQAIITAIFIWREEI